MGKESVKVKYKAVIQQQGSILTKYRIVKLSEYKVLHSLEKKTICGWLETMTGTEDQCRNALNSIKNGRTPNTVVYEEEI